jgi:hypothetical protein
VRNLYESKEKFGRDGRCTERERAVGPIVAWMVVAIIGLLTRQALVGLPPTFWEFFKK